MVSWRERKKYQVIFLSLLSNKFTGERVACAGLVFNVTLG